MSNCLDIIEEEERKQQRREAIREEISRLSEKIDYAVDIQNDLYECLRKIRNHTEQWNSSYKTFQSVELNVKIFLTDVFEGNQAEYLSTEIPDTLSVMLISVRQMEELCNQILSQISSLQEYISDLQRRVQQLYVELMGI